MATLVSAPLPDLDLADACTLTVDTGDVTAPIVSLAIHFSQDAPEQVLDKVPADLAFVYTKTG